MGNDAKSSLIPVVGMLFNTDTDAYNYYNKYAKNVGFSVRKKTMYSDSKGIVRRRDLCCSWEGNYQMKAQPKKRREDKRCGCPAMLMVKLNEDGKYVVTSFVEEHNHSLENPKNAHKLRSHRQLEPSQMASKSQLSKEVQDSLDNDANDECFNITNLVPVVGMVFTTDMEAYNFYNRYAKKAGFSVRKKTSYCNSNGKVKRRDLCCSLEGICQKKYNVKKKRVEKRCGCEAMLIVRLDENEKYVVTSFVEEHNHPLENPENAHNLRSHRQTEPSEVAFLTTMDAMTNPVRDSCGELVFVENAPKLISHGQTESSEVSVLTTKGAITNPVLDSRGELILVQNAHKLRSHGQREPSEVGVMTTLDAMSNPVHDSRGELIQTDLDSSYFKRYGELFHYAQTLVAKGARTNGKFALAMSEMLRTISKLDAVPDSEEHVWTLDNNNSMNHKGLVEESIAGQLGADLLMQDGIRKECSGQPESCKESVLEKVPKRRKCFTSGQAEVVVGPSEAIQEKDQNLAEAPITSLTPVVVPSQEIDNATSVNEIILPRDPSPCSIRL